MRKFGLFIIAIASLFLITGCTDLVNETSENMKNIENGEIKIAMEMKLSTEGLEMAVPIDLDMKFYGENKVHANMKSSILNEEITMEMYGEKKAEEMTVYMSSPMLGDDWYKSTTTVAETDIASANSYLELYNQVENITEIKDEDLASDIVAYKATLAADKALALLEETSSEYEYILEDEIEVKIYLNKDTKYVEKMSLDFGNAVSVEEAGTEFKTGITFEIVFQNLNKTKDFEIPNEVLQAKEITE